MRQNRVLLSVTLCSQDNACDNDYILVMMMTLATMTKSARGTVLVTWEQKQTNEAGVGMKLNIYDGTFLVMRYDPT